MSIIAVAGLGYVGFPLAVEFGKVRKTVGFDLSEQKIESFKHFIDPAGALTKDEICAAKHLTVADRKQAEKVLRVGQKALERGKLGELISADMMFHELIYRLSRNQVIETSMRTNWHHIRRSMAEVLRDPGAIVSVWEQHTEIVEKLFDGQPDTAAQIMERHIGNSYQTIITAVDFAK